MSELNGVHAEHKQIWDLLTLSQRQLSVVTERLTEPGNFLTQFSAMDRPLLLNDDSYDILTFWDDPDDSTALPYVCPCDPAINIGGEVERAQMQTFMTPYLKTTFQIAGCDPSFYDPHLMELLDKPFDSGLSPRDRLNMKIASFLRKSSNKFAVTERNQFYDFLIKGKAEIDGPNIKPKDKWIDLGRDEHLTAVLPEKEDWTNPCADKLGALRNVENMIRDCSGKSSDVDIHIFSPEAATALLSVDERIASLKCCAGDGKVREDVFIDLTQRRAWKGARRIDILLGNRGVQFWELDEKILEEVTMPDGSKKKVKRPVLPPGSVLSLASQDLRPLSIYGRIEHLGALEARPRWTNRWESANGECINYDTHSSPLHTLRCTNSSMLWFPIPSKCPPPPDCPFTVLESTLGDKQNW